MMSRNNRFTKSICIVFLFIIVFFYFFVVTGNPITALPSAGHDDALFFRGFESLISGDWLGRYDNRTLAKGPMLSIISALGAVFGVPAKIAEAVIYLLAAYAIFIITIRSGLHYAAAVALFLFILFNPYLFTSGNRYLRDFLYASFGILAVALAMGTIKASTNRAGTWSAAGLGGVSGCAFLTREEDVWLIVTLTALLSTAALTSIARIGLLRVLEKWRTFIYRGAIACVAMAAPVSLVLLANHFAYGYAIVSEFRSPQFLAAMGALARVGELHPSGYVPVPQRSLDEVFRVAPVTVGIKEHWRRLSPGWSNHGANLIPTYPNEVAGGWFVWAFRDAVAAAGHHSSASAAREFYAQLATEVNAACNAGTLSCRAERASLAPELTIDRLPKLVAATWDALHYIGSMEPGWVTPARSEGDPADLIRWNQFIGPVVVDKSNEYMIGGWIVSMNGEQPFIAAVPDSPIRIIDLTTRVGTDLVEYFNALGKNGVGAVRFSMLVKCLTDGCAVSVMTEKGERQVIQIDQLVKRGDNQIVLSPPFAGRFDVLENNIKSNLSARPLEDQRLAISNYAVKLARIIIPILLFTASVGILMYLLRWRHHQRSDWLFVLAVASGTAVIVRCIIIAFIDITSWRAINILYLGPAFGFCIIYSVVGTFILFNILKHELDHIVIFHRAGKA